ncbi:MAG: 50S ribosomal protein L23 [Bacteroidetes bacterium]|nr:50S ribosomal protein L23 [Bacteroidota bacterium]
MNNSQILIKPLVTEKMQKITDKYKQYGFLVHTEATKPQIIEAIEKMYEVKVAGISTLKYGGKAITRYTKKGFFNGKKSSFKKAIITLEAGQVIDFYANI